MLQIAGGGSFRKSYIKEHTGVAFTQTQEKGKSEKKKTDIKRESHCFYCVKQDHWEEAFPDLEEEQCGQLNYNFGTETYDEDE